MPKATFWATIIVTAVGSTLHGADPARIPVVLSTDVGNEVDDQWAVVYLLTNPRFDVKGLLSAHAPSISPPAGRTSWRILKTVVEERLGMREHPPIVEGASDPLSDRTKPVESPAANFLIELSKGYDENRRLTVLTIGAVTDLASAILKDPGITKRIRVIDMGFTSWPNGGNEFNIANDVKGMQVVLDSDVPLVIGSGDVCRKTLALSLAQAKEMVGGRGPVGDWLFMEFEAWYYRHIKPLRVNDFSKPWIIWDTITLAYVLGMTSQEEYARPRLGDDMVFQKGDGKGKVTWITDVDSKRMWTDFLHWLDQYQATHAIERAPFPGRLTFVDP